jgi:hypothetical protein
MKNIIVKNEDVKRVIAEIPEGHKHIRTTIMLENGVAFTLQEATIASIVRAYTTIKTHPTKNRIELKGKRLRKKKDGYAEWQLLEVKDSCSK